MRAFGTRRGCWALKPARIFPLSPTSSIPSSGIGSPSSLQLARLGRAQAAVVPVQGHRRQPFALGELPAHERGLRGTTTVLTCFFQSRSSIFQSWLRVASTVSGEPSFSSLKIWKKL